MRKNWGTLVLVVGPSGAGKDSIIRGAKLALASDPDFVFPRRVVTRKPDAAVEEHDSVSDMAFALAVAQGDYAVWWKAHGNCYGIPISMEDSLRMGKTVIFNCSRTVLDEVSKVYPSVAVVDVQVKASLLVDRIVGRGRETHEEALRRVSREVPPYPANLAVHPVRNDGTPERAIAAFCALLKSFANVSVKRPDGTPQAALPDRNRQFQVSRAS
ncbi:MAG: phosphonate metabolism protein/1,5-bisphosphokinase (PRPP-forming) PhnN [Hyphomicrobiales bacterium]